MSRDTQDGPGDSSEQSALAAEVSAKDVLAQAMVDYPWLMSVAEAASEIIGERQDVDPDEAHQIVVHLDEPAPEPHEEVIVEEIFEQLRHKRSEVLGRVAPGACFPVRLLGGAWTARNRGVPFDAFKAECANREIGSFCTVFSLPRSARFDISLYGEAGASLLAHSWSAKMAFFYELYMEDASDTFRFDLGNLNFEFGEEFNAFVSGLRGRAASRAAQLRDLRPVNPVFM